MSYGYSPHIRWKEQREQLLEMAAFRKWNGQFFSAWFQDKVNKSQGMSWFSFFLVTWLLHPELGGKVAQEGVGWSHMTLAYIPQTVKESRLTTIRMGIASHSLRLLGQGKWQWPESLRLFFPLPTPNDIPRQVRYWRESRWERIDKCYQGQTRSPEEWRKRRGLWEVFMWAPWWGFPSLLYRCKDWSHSHSRSLCSSTPAASCWFIKE